MTNPTSANLYGIGVGTYSSIVPHISSVSPSMSSVVGPNGPFQIGQRWVNNSANETFTLTSLVSFNGVVTANWEQEGGSGVGTVSSVTGTANEITASPTTGAVVLSFPNVVIFPGNVSTTGTIDTSSTMFASGGIETGGDITFEVAGGKLVSVSYATTAAAGINTFGTVPLVAGTVIVSSTAVTANSIIFLTVQQTDGVSSPGAMTISNKTPGGGFTITSSAGSSDTSIIGWMIVN